MVTTMDEDFVLVARAKGLPRRRVVWYAARNAILPSIATSRWRSALWSRPVAGRDRFQLPGHRLSLVRTRCTLDYTLVQGIFLVITLVVLAANFLADLVYVTLDPRARQEA